MLYFQLVCDCAIAVQVLSKNGFIDLVSFSYIPFIAAKIIEFKLGWLP